jgi:S-adenosylmethionine hydrolase
MSAPAVISLLTDFGDQDTYAGQMRGVITGLNPDVQVIDLTHHIPPQDIVRGAITWADALDAFPPGTIHVGVVDPGVGTSRRAVAAEIGPWRFVAPDNGLLTAIQVRWPTHVVVELNREEWRRKPTSATFHGRDLFSPVAAHWSRGVSISELGSIRETPLIEVPLPTVAVTDVTAAGEILWPDRFGNLITSITTADLPAAIPAEQFRVAVAGNAITGISRCYGDQPPGSLLALWGSSGRLELAITNGSANAQPNLRRGTPVEVRWPMP